MFQYPIVIAAIGGVVVVGAIVANIALWQDEYEDSIPAAKTEQVAHTTGQEPPAKPAPTIKLETTTLPNPAKIQSDLAKTRPNPGKFQPDLAKTRPNPAKSQPDLAKTLPNPANTRPNPANVKALPESAAPVQSQAELKVARAEQPQVQQPKTDGLAPGESIAPPTFDVVRITPDGNAVVAGRADPGSNVLITDNGKVIGELETDTHGEWVFVPDQPFAPGNRQIGLEMQVEGHDPVPSDEVVVLVVPEPQIDVAGQVTQKPRQPLALKFPVKGGASTVLQKPAAAPGANILSVDTVDYDEAGRLMISGNADPATSVFVYLNNQITGKVVSDADGAWQMQPAERVAPGLYTLRADQLKEDGKVQARISMPFSRAAPMEDMPTEPFIIVQPGNSLWRIARSTYGSGFGFTTIYEANKAQITDPDLIYPGQVFALPSDNL
ncbi:MAG: LysM peptidoglycan-binding domain-containing protein [Rhodospirillales bacterium]|nr:LysM peptidoglycan-binding domain-containing protein [Rhodospirillales bacterium]